MIKKLVIVVIAMIVALTVVKMVGPVGEYESVAKVVCVDGDVVTVKDTAGFLYEFDGFGFEKGDIVTLTMFDCDTADIYDDVILDAEVKE